MSVNLIVNRSTKQLTTKVRPAKNPLYRLIHTKTSSNPRTFISQEKQYSSLDISKAVPCLEAPDLTWATNPNHVGQVHRYLAQKGVVKVRLHPHDPESEYLRRLVLSLNRNHGHQLPITHSAKTGFFWDVRPTPGTCQPGCHRARSETMREFPWHTDCSYEEKPPRYFALHVLQHDRHGGGTLSVVEVRRLVELLTPDARSGLMRHEYRIETPPEFIKDPNRQSIVGNLLSVDSKILQAALRFRDDIITPLTERAHRSLAELQQLLQDVDVTSQTALHLSAGDLPKGSVLLMDNRRWLHSRNHVSDPGRHLRRVRWDAVQFSGFG